MKCFLVLLMAGLGLSFDLAHADENLDATRATMQRYQKAQQEQAAKPPNSGVNQHEREAKKTIQKLNRVAANGQNGGNPNCANMGSRYAYDLNNKVGQVQRTLNSPAGRAQDMSSWAIGMYQSVVQTGGIYLHQLQRMGCR